MLRRISGSSFALAMIAIIALKHAALGFCLCQEQLVLSNCDCEMAPVEAASCDCSDGCDEPLEEGPAPTPCDDCVIPLTLDLGDFLWSTDPFSPAPQDATPIVLPTGLEDFTLAGCSDEFTPGSIRGSPPPVGLPIYLRTRVLRL